MKKSPDGRNRSPKASHRTSRRAHAQTSQLPRLGLSATYEKVVPQEWTIQAYDPSLPPVLSTPAMIAMIDAQIQLRSTNRIEVDHLKAVPVGATAIASARLVRYRGRFLVFDVEARSGATILGRGRVFRAIVHPEKFHAKAQSRALSAPSRAC